MRKSLHTATAISLIGLILFLCAGCGGGGGGGSSDPVTGGGWVTIQIPGEGPGHTDYCNAAALRGQAFISPDWFRCCSGSAEDTGVTVSWRNLTTGASGPASQRVRTCWALTQYLCDHTWSADIPLALGTNEITVTAEDPGGRTGSATVRIDHPETSYAVSGLVTTERGHGLAFRETNLEIVLSDGTVSTRAVTGTDGGYRFACVRNGDYTLTPVSPIAYDFSPTELRPTVFGADVPNQNFSTEAYFLSGTVPTGMLVEVTGPGTSSTHWAGVDGTYRIALPSGSYTVRAYDPLGIVTIAPSDLPIVIAGEDVAGPDFVIAP
jgi:hypothetical protein